MKGDKTLIQQSLTGHDLDEDDARRLAEKIQLDSEAMARFLKIEDQLDDIIKGVEKAKKAIKWLLGLLAANYALTFSDMIKSVIIG